jgi:MFS family permease
MSGWIISALQFGVGFGSFTIWSTNRVHVDGSLKNMRGLSLVASGLTTLGTCAYAVLAWSPPNAWSLMVARCITGFGIGIQTSAGRYFINRTAYGTEIKEVNTALAIWGVLGLGFGPLLEAGQNQIYGVVCGSYPTSGRGAEYQGMVVLALFVVLVTSIFPKTEEIRDRIPESRPRTESESRNEEFSATSYPYRFAILACLIICGIRSFSMASIESATAMLLDDTFGLSERAVGLLISVTFIFTVPLKMFFDSVGGIGRHANSIRLLMLICVLGCLLLRVDLGKLLSGGSTNGRVAVIIVADALLFPAIFLTGAVIESVGFRLASPEGTLFSTNNYVAMTNVAATIFGRGLGPPTARAILTTPSGQTAYSWQQLLISSLAVVLMEATVIQHLHFLDEDFKTDVLRPSKEAPAAENGNAAEMGKKVSTPVAEKN